MLDFEQSDKLKILSIFNQPPDNPRTKRTTIPCFVTVLVQLT